MTDLAFPEIEAPAERTAIAAAATAALDLTKIDLTDVALAQFGDWRGAVTLAERRLKNVAWDVSTPKGFADIKTMRHTVTKVPRAEANKIADGLVSKITAVSKQVRAEQALIVAAYDKLAEPLTKIIDARQAEIDETERQAETARAAAAAAEAARKAAHEIGIAKIRGYLVRCQEPGMTAERIATGIAQLESAAIGPEWEEYAEDAKTTKRVTLEAMRTLHAQTLGREQEAARLELQRQENERVAAELAAARAAIEADAARVRQQSAELAAREAAAEAERESRINAEVASMLAAMPQPPAVQAAADLNTEAAPASPARDGSQKPDDDAADAPSSELAVITEGQHPQQVLKAKPATADATDRGIAANISPRGGAMGAGQAAAAAPDAESEPIIGGTPEGHLCQDINRGLSLALAGKPDAMLHAREAAAQIAADTAAAVLTSPIKLAAELAQARALLADAAQLARYAQTAFDGRWKSHPKPSAEWWEGLAERLSGFQSAMA